MGCRGGGKSNQVTLCDTVVLADPVKSDTREALPFGTSSEPAELHLLLQSLHLLLQSARACSSPNAPSKALDDEAEGTAGGTGGLEMGSHCSCRS